MCIDLRFLDNRMILIVSLILLLVGQNCATNSSQSTSGQSSVIESSKEVFSVSALLSENTNNSRSNAFTDKHTVLNEDVFQFQRNETQKGTKKESTPQKNQSSSENVTVVNGIFTSTSSPYENVENLQFSNPTEEEDIFSVHQGENESHINNIGNSSKTENVRTYELSDTAAGSLSVPYDNTTAHKVSTLGTQVSEDYTTSPDKDSNSLTTIGIQLASEVISSSENGEVSVSTIIIPNLTSYEENDHTDLTPNPDEQRSTQHALTSTSFIDQATNSAGLNSKERNVTELIEISASTSTPRIAGNETGAYIINQNHDIKTLPASYSSQTIEEMFSKTQNKHSAAETKYSDPQANEYHDLHNSEKINVKDDPAIIMPADTNSVTPQQIIIQEDTNSVTPQEIIMPENTNSVIPQQIIIQEDTNSVTPQAIMLADTNSMTAEAVIPEDTNSVPPQANPRTLSNLNNSNDRKHHTELLSPLHQQARSISIAQIPQRKTLKNLMSPRIPLHRLSKLENNVPLFNQRPAYGKDLISSVVTSPILPVRKPGTPHLRPLSGISMIATHHGKPWLAAPEEEPSDYEVWSAIVSSLAKWEEKKKKKLLHKNHVHKRSEEVVCYRGFGCFTDEGAFDYLDTLPASPESIATKFVLYTNKSKTNGELLWYDNSSSLYYSHFNGSNPVKIIIHGFGSSGRRMWVLQMSEALLAMEDVNIIIVDWEKGSSLPNYVQAAANTQLVGKQLAALIRMINYERGLTNSDYHLIGFSLGAHVAGFAGMECRNISRITGLDPASPLFEGYDPKIRLDPSDATFVDVIHSNGNSFLKGGLGMFEPSGHIDFYPNGGRVQIGCNNVFIGAVNDILYGKWQSLCNHRRAFRFFIDSIIPSCTFPAFQCDSYDNFLLGKCFRCHVEHGCVNMGYYADRTQKARGKYYLVTRDSEPFCANQYRISIVSTRNQGTTWGKLEITFIGEDNGNETFFLTSESQEISDKQDIQGLIVADPSLRNVTAVILKYSKYRGWIYSGLDRWDIDRIQIHNSNGQVMSFCGNGIPIINNEPKLIPLLRGECTSERPSQRLARFYWQVVGEPTMGRDPRPPKLLWKLMVDDTPKYHWHGSKK